jgi:hypothetical protein
MPGLSGKVGAGRLTGKRECPVMKNNVARRTGSSAAIGLLALMLLFGSIGVFISTANDIDLDDVTASASMDADETAYYEYVAPRLDRLVMEMDETVEMVQGKSRDILALTVSGNRIETLTAEIVAYGDDHGVPVMFAEVHSMIVDATSTAIGTFEEARTALRTFNFSGMSGLVEGLTAAATDLHAAQEEMGRRGGGTKDA